MKVLSSRSGQLVMIAAAAALVYWTLPPHMRQKINRGTYESFNYIREFFRSISGQTRGDRSNNSQTSVIGGRGASLPQTLTMGGAAIPVIPSVAGTGGPSLISPAAPAVITTQYNPNNGSFVPFESQSGLRIGCSKPLEGIAYLLF